jgi:hypothetical protein
MATIVLRNVKGSFLTHTEVDNNFSNLNNFKLETTNNLSDLTNAANARTNLGANNASNLTTGTVPSARLGSGTADATTFLRGDNTWALVELPAGLSAGSTSTGFLQYAGTTKTAGQNYGGTTAPTSTTRLNYDGYFYATRFYGDGSNLTNITGTSIATTSNVQLNSLGVGTAGSATTGEIRATNNVTAYYSSDIKFKENIREIPDALSKVVAIGGKLFDWTDEYIESKGGEDGYFVQKADFGMIAQDVKKVFPVAVRTRPDGSLAVDYEKLSALAFAAIAVLKKEVEELKGKN